MSRTSWEEFNYPLAASNEVIHTLAEDLRKKLWLILIGAKTSVERNSRPTIVAGSNSKTYRCKVSHTAVTADNKPVTGTNWTDFWQLHSDADGWGETWVDGTNYVNGYAAGGSFRTQNFLFDWNATGLNTIKRRGPGYMTCWHHEAWGNSIGGASSTDYNIKAATLGYTSSGLSEVWILDNIINTYVTGEETVAGNLLVGCPFEISGVTGAAGDEMNGFWRIKVVTPVNLSGNDYVLLQLEDFHGDSDLNFSQEWGPIGWPYYTAGGEVECDFGGDWYMWCPGNLNIDFTMDAEMKYIGTDNARADGEKRPPDGGIYSKDYNSYWRRTVNPYNYFHYDVNAHRWIGDTRRTGSEEPRTDYWTVYESWRLLPVNTDPKEQVPPYTYKDTGRIDWRIAGNKREIDKEHLTDWPVMDAPQGSQIGLRTNPSTLVLTTDETNVTVSWDALTESFITAQHPPMSGSSGLNNQWDPWKETKYDSRCLWAWIDIACSRGFVADVDNDITFKENWLEENRLVVDPVTLTGDPGSPGDTYEDKWWSTVWNLDGYRPLYNALQPRYDYLSSRFWGQNGRAIEKVLADLGDYDWWYDINSKYVPYPIKDIYGNIYYGEANNHDTPPASGSVAAEWEHPTPHGTWRKVPKWSLSYVDGDEATDPGVDGYMRDKESGEPNGSEIVASYPTIMHNGAGPDTGEWVHFHSLYSKQAPAISEFGDYTEVGDTLFDRHGPVHIHDSVAFYERTIKVLQLMIDVIDQLENFFDETLSLGYEEVGTDNIHMSEAPVAHWPTVEEAQDWTYSQKAAFVVGDMESLWTSLLRWASPARLVIGWLSQAYTDVAYDNWFVIAGTEHDFWWGAITLPANIEYPIDNLLWAVKVTIYRDNAYFGVSGERGRIPVVGFNDDLLLTADEDPDIEVHGWTDLLLSKTTDPTRLMFTLQNPDTPITYWSTGQPPSVDRYYGIKNRCFIYLTVSYPMIRIDRDKYPETIWDRDITYAKKLLFDPTEDEEPPVHTPVEFFLTPILYDANIPEGHGDDWYDYPSNIAEWHVKMSSKLLTDLEGNNVVYEIIGSGGTGTKKAVDFNRLFDHANEDQRTYDFILDMDVGTDPGDAVDLAEAITNGLGSTWLFKIKAKDKASDAGAGQTDNETEYSSTSGVDITAAP